MDERPTTLATRFGWFALGHFLISIVLTALFVCVIGPLAAVVMDGAPEWTASALLAGMTTLALGAYFLAGAYTASALLAGMTTLALGAYFLAGAYTASARRWTAPAKDAERFLAILLPTLVAWAWEGAAIAGMAGDFPLLQALAGMLLYSALFLASPSVLFLFFCIGVLHVGMWLDDPGFWMMAALAGALPPLLFALGSFWQAGRRPTPPEALQEPER